MSKYIDADEFKKKLRERHKAGIIGRKVLICEFKAINEMPSADVVEVIRCKDCKYWEYTCQEDFDFAYGDCLFWQIEHCSDYYMETTGNHYCGFARERKETE